MFQKWSTLFFAGVLALGISLPVRAAQEGGSISLSLDTGELPALNGAITLYQVGVPAGEGYRIVENFGSGFVRAEDTASQELALWLADAAGDFGWTINVDVEGDVTFSGLTDGLYLLLQTQRTDGFHPIAPQLVTIPCVGAYQVHLNPATNPIIWENPQTGQPITPLLGAMGMALSGVGLYLCLDRRRKK